MFIVDCIKFWVAPEVLLVKSGSKLNVVEISKKVVFTSTNSVSMLATAKLFVSSLIILDLTSSFVASSTPDLNFNDTNTFP